MSTHLRTAITSPPLSSTYPLTSRYGYTLARVRKKAGAAVDKILDAVMDTAQAFPRRLSALS
jgi:hypothetical protein